MGEAQYSQSFGEGQAVAAVQQWKYEPTTVSGEPVEVQAKVYVTFEFSQQQSEQKQ